MNDILDNAAVRSAQVVKAVRQTAFAGRLRRRAAVVRAVAETAWELVEPRLEERLRAATVVVTSGSSSESAQEPRRELAPAGHGPLATPADGPSMPGEDEKCTCRGTGDNWCGATKRDVVHDLTTRGARLSREQAEHIWASAQARRSAEAPA